MSNEHSKYNLFCFTENMSIGYTELMNKVGLLKVLFHHFEQFMMNDRSIPISNNDKYVNFTKFSVKSLV